MTLVAMTLVAQAGIPVRQCCSRKEGGPWGVSGFAWCWKGLPASCAWSTPAKPGAPLVGTSLSLSEWSTSGRPGAPCLWHAQGRHVFKLLAVDVRSDEGAHSVAQPARIYLQVHQCVP